MSIHDLANAKLKEDENQLYLYQFKKVDAGTNNYYECSGGTIIPLTKWSTVNKPEEAAKRGKTWENSQKHINEYGITIYGKIVGNAYGLLSNASPVVQKMKDARKMTDEHIIRDGFAITYSEYYSDTYGGIVYLVTSDKAGGKELYNENGHCILTYSSKSKDADLEKSLANYKMGSVLTDIIDKNTK